jgi:phage FluMu gp28-like protein
LECAESLETFAKYVVTKDEHGIGESSVRPFPTREQKPYIWDILDTIQAEQLVAIEKSRQLMVTWLVCLYCLWCAKYQKNRLIFIQSKKEDDACNLVFNSEWTVGRISFMEYNLPESMKSEIATSYGKMNFRETGSRIIAIPEGGDQIRSYTASLIYSDEAAFQPEFENAWKASNPSIKGGGKMVIVSSARNGSYMKRLISRT